MRIFEWKCFFLKLHVSLEGLSHLKNSNPWVQLWLNLALTVSEAGRVCCDFIPWYKITSVAFQQVLAVVLARLYSSSGALCRKCLETAMKTKSQATNWNEPGCSFLVWQCWHGISVSFLSLRFYKSIFFFSEGRTKILISEFVKLRKNTFDLWLSLPVFHHYIFLEIYIYIYITVYFLIPFHEIILGKIVNRNTPLHLRIKYFSVTEFRTAGNFSTVLILYRIIPI